MVGRANLDFIVIVQHYLYSLVIKVKYNRTLPQR